MPADRYHFAYTEDSPYRHAVRLLADHTFVEDGVVVDVGCGYGAIAEPLRELRLAYVGVDVEPAGVADICHRGFEGAVVDLAEPDRLGSRIVELLAGRPLAALCALDVLEHLTNGPAVLAALRDLAIAQGRVPLVVSIPNVAHLDLAAKLLLGRWDVTPTGLLDETHVALYAPARLEAVLEAAGWAEVGEADFELVESDQHFPPDAPVLAPTPLHDLLVGIRRRAAPGATTNQFVRAYVPAAIPPVSDGPDEGPAPFLSVLLLDGGDDERLLDALVALDAQDLPDGEDEWGPAGLEVLCCLAHADPARAAAVEALAAPFTARLARRTRVVVAPAPPTTPSWTARARLLDVAARAARGRYVTVLEDGDLPFAHWLETFARLAADQPGAVVRSLALSQPLRSLRWPGGRLGHEPASGAEVASASSFDLVDHLRHGGSPPGSYALPRAFLADLGHTFAEGTPGLEDDHLLARAASLCGIREDPTTAVLLRRPPVGAADGADGAVGADGAPDRADLLAALDAEPVLLPAGTLAGIVLAVSPDASAAEVSGAEAGGDLEAAEARAEAAATERAEAEAALAATRAELRAVRAELAAVRASTSWRFTAPLRRLGDRRPR